ncbi:pilus assembly PilX family protein [Thiohalophilus sp.]|uniref:pilus assembly PilX family protein n=1 Tax=Thiohalophilus sp. TaxID=3028392 RepID=UPI002ACE51A9|nr:PilX N-terminal domain-containing pilus assembly protein [Thiohalophilus sp.]MDZ7663692.1 PilX N-terminal domain-containing pilus assembly protein [Thiohalophilus sp.]
MTIKAQNPKTIQMNLAGKQQGVVLIVSLMLLVVITLLGISGMRNTTLDERMAGNMRDLQLAFYSAESALREAEQQIKVISLPPFNNTNGYYETDSTLWQTIDWSDTSAVIQVTTTIDEVSAPPAYYVEEMPATPSDGSLEAGIPHDSEVYRITARGVGGSTTSVAILQATVRR